MTALVLLILATLPNPREVPFVDVETAGRFLKVGRSKAYEQCRRFLDTEGAEGIPAIELGRAIRVPVSALWRLAGLNPERDEGPAVDAEPVANIRPLTIAVDGHDNPAA